jgi:hypothetical protein
MMTNKLLITHSLVQVFVFIALISLSFFSREIIPFYPGIEPLIIVSFLTMLISVLIYYFLLKIKQKNENKNFVVILFFQPVLFLFILIGIFLAFENKETRNTVLIFSLIYYLFYRLVLLFFTSKANKTE